MSHRALVPVIVLVLLAGCAAGGDTGNARDLGSGGAENGDASFAAGGNAGATGQAGTTGMINVAGAAGDSSGLSDGSVAPDPHAARALGAGDSPLIPPAPFLLVGRPPSLGASPPQTGGADPRKIELIAPPTPRA